MYILKQVCAWFEIAFVQEVGMHFCVCVYVCVFVYVSMCVFVCVFCLLLSTRLSGIVWTQYDWVNKFYNFYMSAVVDVVSRCGSSIDAHHRNQPSEGRLVLY